ncbi:MAG TPA: alkaline phosphatase family protein [Burkholderiales bacterium]|nr:alkaline phosphatase family protein [Burkholderiales bacterium]
MRTLISLGIAGLLLNAGTEAALAWKNNETETATPIRHLVVIFQENISFDHYFGTYPVAANLPGEPAFYALPHTPSVNGLGGALVTNNPDFLNTANTPGNVNPFRLGPANASTADQDHDYTPEQQAADAGLMDLYPKYTGAGGTANGSPPPTGSPPAFTTNGLAMAYYDGNTITALWNYAQYFAMSDNSYGTMFGPSTVGALNLVAGQTNGVIGHTPDTSDLSDDGYGGFTVTGDPQPLNDVCSTRDAAQMGGKNIGDLLTAADVTWGWFMGGFDLTVKNANGTTGCARTTKSAITQVTKVDYIPHHQPFQYYVSTANWKHTRPSSVVSIGHNGDAGNHQYDINDFYSAVNAHNFPAVSFLKAPGYQDGHPGYSDPIDEQHFLVHVLNFLQKQPEWESTAVVISYDDSDGWYDHQMGPIVNQSTGAADALTGPGHCGDGSTALPGIDPTAEPHAQGRCGYGPRLPLLVISPWSKRNFVDHTVTDQSSIVRFIEDNWLDGERIGQGSFDALAGSLGNMFDFGHRHGEARALFLDENTGQPLHR